MKKRLISLVIGLAVLGTGLATAAVQVRKDAAKVGLTETLNYTTGISASMSGADVVVAVSNVPSSGINWQDVKSAEIQSAGINWSNIILDSSSGINWSAIAL